jgi:hypothetical protein
MKSADPEYVFARFVFGVELVGAGKPRIIEKRAVEMKTGAPGRDSSCVGQLSMLECTVALTEALAGFAVAGHVVNSLTAPARWAATSRKAVDRA